MRSRLSPAALAVSCLALAACQESDSARLQPYQGLKSRILDGDARQGQQLVAEIGCGACHIIPGVAGPRGIVGPPLEGFGRRAMIAGIVPNQPAVLMRWIRDAPSIAPETAMPDFALTESEARDIAAFLYGLR